MTDRTDRLKTADGAGAFDVVSAMEKPLTKIAQAKAALLIISEDSQLQGEFQQALSLLTEIISGAVNEAEEMRAEAWKKTWAYRHGATAPVHQLRAG